MRGGFKIAKAARDNHSRRMSVAQVTREIEHMTVDEQFHVAAFIQHLADERDDDHRERLDAAMNRIDEGRKVAFDEVMARHADLERRGM